jgi:hypothetical protein
VVTAGGHASSAATFNYDTTPAADEPYISYLSPTSGVANTDTVVAIVGGNFDSQTSSCSVTFGPYPATISSWTDAQIVVTAPNLGEIASSVTYEVKVTRSDGRYATSYYTYIAPTSTGGTTTPSGMPMWVWAGLISANGALAVLVKRRFF